MSCLLVNLRKKTIERRLEQELGVEVECRSEEIYVDGGSGEDLDDGEDVREGAMSRAVVVMSLLTETWRCGRDLAEAEILREDVEARMSMAVVVPWW